MDRGNGSRTVRSGRTWDDDRRPPTLDECLARIGELEYVVQERTRERDERSRELEADNARLRAALTAMPNVLSFLKSIVQGGEQWSTQAQTAYNEACTTIAAVLSAEGESANTGECEHGHGLTDYCQSCAGINLPAEGGK